MRRFGLIFDSFPAMTAARRRGSSEAPRPPWVTDTAVDAIAPPLSGLKDAFLLTLQRGEGRANELLDDVLSAGEQPLIVKVDLTLHNREVTTEAEVEELVNEIRERLLAQVLAGNQPIQPSFVKAKKVFFKRLP